MQALFRLTLVGCLLPAPMLLAQHDSDLNGNFPFNETIHIVQQGAVGGSLRHESLWTGKYGGL